MSKQKRFITTTYQAGRCYCVYDRQSSVYVGQFWFYGGEAQTPYTRARLFAKLLNDQLKGLNHAPNQ